MQSALAGLLLLPLYASAALALKRRSGLAADSCACLSWRETYASGKVACGDAFEFTSAAYFINTTMGGNGGSNPDAIYQPFLSPKGWMASGLGNMVRDHFYGQYCEDVFMKMPSSTCVKVAPATNPYMWYGKSWCYVSSECQSLQGGVTVTPTVSAKICDSSTDDIMGDKSPQEIIDLFTADGHAPGIGYLVSMAYPNVGDDFVTAVHEPTPKETQARSFGKPVLWTDAKAGKTFVLHGSQTWDCTGNKCACKEGCL